LLLNG